MLFPGYVTLFKDKENNIHLYFFPGIDDSNQYYYNKLDLSDSTVQFEQKNYIDNSVEYIFKSKNIVRITCKLISKHNKVEFKTFNV